MLDHHPVAITVEVKQEEDIKPPSPLVLNSEQSYTFEQREEHELVHLMERSVLPSLSSVDVKMTLSPSYIPRRDDFFHHGNGGHFRSQLGYGPQHLQNLEHQIILENKKKFGLYVRKKRDGLKRTQQLEEELLQLKIEVERLKSIRLQHDLPEYDSF
ncbi:fibrinogen silencer-binding protein-like [Phyllostomus hastatus]|uniref:fibrinogen silencer-binding protein-like n=1 Tax=Phyllostomus hastatus TaxID=9423 RepID=UPI001E680252|nr:fibrinogen silencer-binding protein-like [Phyllostomus hastatus]